MAKHKVVKMTLYLVGCDEFGDGNAFDPLHIEGDLQHRPLLYRIADVEQRSVEVDDFDESELNDCSFIDDPARFQEILDGSEIRSVT